MSSTDSPPAPLQDLLKMGEMAVYAPGQRLLIPLSGERKVMSTSQWFCVFVAKVACLIKTTLYWTELSVLCSVSRQFEIVRVNGHVIKVETFSFDTKSFGYTVG